MKYIHHHLGLGDHIINNGMVRHFCKEYGAISLFAYNHNLKNVEYMYRDIDRVKIIGVESDMEADEYVSKNNLDCMKIIRSSQKCDLPFDKAFYKLAGLDFSVRFNEFYYERDLEEEKRVLNTLNPDNERYVFIHDDPSRRFKINMDRIRTSYRVIMNDKRFNVFDYLTLIERAEEIHFMQSSFKELICSYKLMKPKLYQHNYVRNYGGYLNSSGLNEIQEIKS